MVVPSFQKDIPYLPVKDIDFRSAKRKKMEMECKGLCTPPTEVQPFKMKDQLQAPTDIELNEFFDKLSKCIRRNQPFCLLFRNMPSVMS